MERVIFVEILGRRGEVVQRSRLERLPATIGRGYGCDVIVSDPLADVEHARIVQDETGTLAIEDLGSRNGLFADGARRKTPRLPVQGVTTARVGRTVLRVVPADAALPAALPDTEAGDRLVWALTTPRWSTLIIVAGAAAAALELWLDTFESRGLSIAGGETLSLLLGSALWAGAWALIGRASVQRFSFRPHLAATWLFLGLLFVTSTLSGYGRFLWPEGPFAGLGMLAILALTVALLARHLGFATTLGRRRRVLIGTAATAGVVGLVMLAGRIATDEFDEGGTVSVSAVVKPLPAAWIPASGLEALLKDADKLKRQLDLLKDPRRD